MMSSVFCILRVESNNIRSIQHALDFLRKESVQHEILLENEVSLPMRRTLYTVLRSPHIDKKSREQFEFRKYAMTVSTSKTDRNIVNTFLTSIKENLLLDVSLKVKFISNETLDLQ